MGLFTAAQAAQKAESTKRALEYAFTAAQAAQKVDDFHI